MSMMELILNLQADQTETTRLQAALDQFAAQCSLSEEVSFKLNLVLDELITNAISYGLNTVVQPEIHVRITLDQDYAYVCLRDNGQAFDPFSEAPEPDIDAALEQRRIGGLGVHFVRSMMDTCHYQREGEWNVITMTLGLNDQ